MKAAKGPKYIEFNTVALYSESTAQQELVRGVGERKREKKRSHLSLINPKPRLTSHLHLIWSHLFHHWNVSNSCDYDSQTLMGTQRTLTPLTLTNPEGSYNAHMLQVSWTVNPNICLLDWTPNCLRISSRGFLVYKLLCRWIS